MAHRLLVFLLFCCACSRPQVIYEDAVLTVVEQPRARDFDRLRFQEYRSAAGNVVLNGGAAGILDFLARAQVQRGNLREQGGGATDRHLVVVLREGRRLDDPAVLASFLEAMKKL